MKINRRKFVYVGIGAIIATASGTAITEYYLAPGYFSSLLSKWTCRQREGQLLRLSQTVKPETVTKVYLTKEDVASFSETDSDSLAVKVQLENISDIHLENVKLQHYGLGGFKFSNALLGSLDIPEEKYSAVTPSSVINDRIEFNFPNLPCGKGAILKLIYIPQPDAKDSDTVAEGIAQYYDEGWPNIQKPIDPCEGYYNVSSTATTAVRVKETKIQLVDLELQLFHDYHGDGAKQDDEPFITDVMFDVRDDKGNKILKEIKGNDNGIYRLDDLKEGRNYRLEFSNETIMKYRHIAISNEKFVGIGDYEFIANPEKTRIELGLMNGYLTLPFRRGTYCPISDYFDRGGGVGWRGHKSYRTHNGTDFPVESGKEVCSPASGKIIATEFGWPNNPNTRAPGPGTHEGGNYIAIYLDNNMQVLLYHLRELLVEPVQFGTPGRKVRRGEVIATAGNTGLFYGRKMTPHLHLTLSNFTQKPDWALGIDPFDDFNSSWTKDNDPQYPL